MNTMVLGGSDQYRNVDVCVLHFKYNFITPSHAYNQWKLRKMRNSLFCKCLFRLGERVPNTEIMVKLNQPILSWLVKIPEVRCRHTVMSLLL